MVKKYSIREKREGERGRGDFVKEMYRNREVKGKKRRSKEREV